MRSRARGETRGAERKTGEGGGRRSQGTQAAKDLHRYVSVIGSLNIAHVYTHTYTHRSRVCWRLSDASPLQAMKPGNGLALEVCNNGARKESPFAKILPKSGHEQGGLHAKISRPLRSRGVFLSPGRPRLLARLQNALANKFDYSRGTRARANSGENRAPMASVGLLTGLRHDNARRVMADNALLGAPIVPSRLSPPPGAVSPQSPRANLCRNGSAAKSVDRARSLAHPRNVPSARSRTCADGFFILIEDPERRRRCPRSLIVTGQHRTLSYNYKSRAFRRAATTLRLFP